MVSPHTALRKFVEESNLIEFIFRNPTVKEVKAHEAFLGTPVLKISDLEQFVDKISPHHVLRRHTGLDVLVGLYRPPPGGPDIERRLKSIIDEAMAWKYSSTATKEQTELAAFDLHCRYETLHPFTDGNGRSGRLLWLWMMGVFNVPDGFLRTFYIQALQHHDSRSGI